MRVGIIGLGYVGLTLAVAAAARGVDVYGVETNEHIKDCLKQDRTYFYEPGLDNLIKRVNHKTLHVVERFVPVEGGYLNLSFNQFLVNKFENIKTLFMLPRNFSRQGLIDYEFYYFFGSFGVLVFAVYFLWKEKIKNLQRLSELSSFHAVFLVSLALFCLFKFEPGTTIVHEGPPIAVMMLLFLISWGLDFAPPAFRFIYLLLHFMTFIYLYAIKDNALVNVIELTAFFFSMLFLVLFLYRFEAFPASRET